LELAPGDPVANMPLTIPPEVRELIRDALGVGQPVYIAFPKWLYQFFILEPMVFIDYLTNESAMATLLPNTDLYTRCDGSNYETCDLRIISWQTRSSVMEIVWQRMPQTLWVVGTSYVLGVLIALPIGIISAYKQYSVFDQVGTFVSMVGFSVPTFFTGVLLIVIFSVWLGWFPSIYDTTHVVNDWESFVFQVRQMIMPVFVLALFNAAQISRFMRASMLDNLTQDYVRTARAKALNEKVVVLVHVLRNSLIPVVTVIAPGAPQVFAGAILPDPVLQVTGRRPL